MITLIIVLALLTNVLPASGRAKADAENDKMPRVQGRSRAMNFAAAAN